MKTKKITMRTSLNPSSPLRVQLFGTGDLQLIDSIRRHIRALVPTVGSRLKPGIINIVITSDAHIRQLNRRYLKRNRPTDVLTFKLNLPQEPQHQTILGEIYISRERARHQAKAGGRKLREEILFLVRHGLLHLAGFSHQEMSRLP
ncbi:MAG: rRNA maturation RNase YbeY [bacterium]